jgi:hypothetical protein
MIGRDLNLKMILLDKLGSLFKKMDSSNYPYFNTNLQQDSYSFQLIQNDKNIKTKFVNASSSIIWTPIF